MKIDEETLDSKEEEVLKRIFRDKDHLFGYIISDGYKKWTVKESAFFLPDNEKMLLRLALSLIGSEAVSLSKLDVLKKEEDKRAAIEAFEIFMGISKGEEPLVPRGRWLDMMETKALENLFCNNIVLLKSIKEDQYAENYPVSELSGSDVIKLNFARALLCNGKVNLKEIQSLPFQDQGRAYQALGAFLESNYLEH